MEQAKKPRYYHPIQDPSCKVRVAFQEKKSLPLGLETSKEIFSIGRSQP